jgi:hypothetical protein
MAVIGLGEYLVRVLHIVFQKAVKTGGRTIDGLWAAMGAVMDTARGEIVKGAAMMHPATAEGDYADRHAWNCAHITRLPGESDASLTARLKFDFWRAAGTGPFFDEHGPRMGVTLTIERTRAYVRRVTIDGLPIDQTRFYAEMNKFRPAHVLFDYELAGGYEYLRLDEPDVDTWRLDSFVRLNTIVEAP